MTDYQTRAQPGVPELATLLFEIDDTWRAIEHGRAGVQPAVDPVRESERVAAAWRALDEYARSAFPTEKE